MAVIRELADAYGAGRMLWASAYPWICDVAGYRRLLELPDRMLPGPVRRRARRDYGGTARALFSGLSDSIV